ncbi:MAG: efflux RND transporter periplasmic adaptor subunit [Magnetococcales bacterium]|nr:efflux RND transporter periplasmic adaptor subunit [Magnetococcales bacterium]
MPPRCWRYWPRGPALRNFFKGAAVFFCLFLVHHVCTAAPDDAVKPTPPPSAAPELRAELIARQLTTLSSEIGAVIIKLPFREGDFFKEGDLLVGLDCAVQLAKLQRAKAVMQAEAEKGEILGRLDQLNVTSKLELTNARAEEAKARADLAIITAEMKSCRITAPFPGQVVHLDVREFQYVKPGQTLMDIHNPSALELVVNMPSRWMRRYHKGDRFLLRVDETGNSYPARIVTFGGKIDAVNQLVRMTGEVIGRFPELSPGMSGQVVLDFSQ